MKRLGIPTTSIAAALLAASSAEANLPEANHALDSSPDVVEFFEETSRPESQKILIKELWEKYKAHTLGCVVPKDQTNEISILKTPDYGSETITTCEDSADIQNRNYFSMMEIADKIMESTKIQCGFITVRHQSGNQFELAVQNLGVVENCERSLEGAFPTVSFFPDSDYEINEGFRVLQPENCDLDHNDEDLAKWCKDEGS